MFIRAHITLANTVLEAKDGYQKGLVDNYIIRISKHFPHHLLLLLQLQVAGKVTVDQFLPHVPTIHFCRNLFIQCNDLIFPL